MGEPSAGRVFIPPRGAGTGLQGPRFPGGTEMFAPGGFANKSQSWQGGEGEPRAGAGPWVRDAPRGGNPSPGRQQDQRCRRRTGHHGSSHLAVAAGSLWGQPAAQWGCSRGRAAPLLLLLPPPRPLPFSSFPQNEHPGGTLGHRQPPCADVPWRAPCRPSWLETAAWGRRLCWSSLTRASSSQAPSPPPWALALR